MYWAEDESHTVVTCRKDELLVVLRFFVYVVGLLPYDNIHVLAHNEIRDITTNFLSEVCNDVWIKPNLQEVTIEELSRRLVITTAGARLDIATRGFWEGRFEWIFVDVSVFNPYIPSNKNTTVGAATQFHESFVLMFYSY